MIKYFHLYFFKDNIFIFALSIINSIIRSIILLIPTILIHYLIEEGLLRKNFKILLITSISSFVIVIITNILILLDLYLNRYILTYFSKLRVNLFASYINNSISQISNYLSGDLVHRFLIETERLAIYFYIGISNIIWINTTIIIGIVLLIIKGGRISIYALSLLFCRLFIVNIIAKRKTKLGDKINKSESDFIQVIKENTDNLEFIKTTNSEERVIKEIKEKIGEVYLNNLKILKVELAIKFIDGFFDSAIRMVFIGLGCFMILKNNILLGTVVALMTVYEWIIPAIEGYISIILDMIKQNNYMERIISLLKNKRNRKNNDVIPLSFDIELKNIECHDKNNNTLFKPVTFNIPLGKKVFLIGQSGIGKTTLAESLTKMHLSYNGEIKIGGIDLKIINEKWIRRNIILVNQNSILFNWSIKDNIVFFDNYSNEEIYFVLKLLCLDTWIDSLSDGLDTIVGEQSRLISGGQAQRIILARALLRKAPIYILDESLSKVDEKTSIKILNNIYKKFTDTTFLIISHNNLISSSILKNKDIIKIKLYKEV